MAEALVNKLAIGRLRATSAGTEPAETIGPTVIEVMREVGTDISHQKPKRLTSEMIKQADKVIAMGCGVDEVCPATFMDVDDWEIDDPRGEPLEKVREIRDKIKARVLEMMRDVEYSS